MRAADFKALLSNVRRSGSGYTARCPAHDDEHNSLSFGDGDYGLVWKCHAGCSYEQILAALRLTFADVRRSTSAPHVVAEYQYRDEHGKLLYVVERLEPKRFRQKRPDGRGGWIYKLDGVRRVLYRLQELRHQKIVYLVEGEKDADRLWSIGIPATTAPGGAGKWRDEYTEQLKAVGVEHLVILPDNDEPGERHAEAVARSCHAAGLVVKVVRLPGLPPKGDVSAWLDSGRSREELAEVVRSVPLWAPSETSPAEPRGLRFTPLAELLDEQDEAVAWIVKDRLPSRGLSILAGKPKSGKSTLARCLALAVARGDAWLGHATTRGLVFYLALEDKRAEVRAHFKTMGATAEDHVKAFIAPSPQDGLAQLREAAERERPTLIIVDPLLKLVRVRDANDYAAVTAALEPLLTLARETGAHVLTVHHVGKGERSGGDAILGSTAIFAAVDTALILKRSERYRTLSSIQRYGEDLEEITLTLDPATRWISAGPSRREADEAEAAEGISAYLAEQTEPMPESAVIEAVEGRGALKERALRRLVAEGRVVRIGAGRRGDPFRYSISPSLPPAYTREGENRNAKITVSSDGESAYSPSRKIAVSVSPSRDSEGIEEVEL